ncbi:MAG: aquaporin family protein [Variovorax sp.]|nr:aquaporin family protein [Variovorax sp.]
MALKPSPAALRRALAAEFVGTALLLATVVGSGIGSERLAGGNLALALLANSLASGLVLGVLIASFAPVSGGHLNPLVSLMEWALKRCSAPTAALYLVAQVAGACAGVMLAQAMFGLPVAQSATQVHTGLSQWLSELVAAFGLMTITLHLIKTKPEAVPAAVGCYIVAAIWFTGSGSFSNPAGTLARSLTDTFTGIRPVDVPAFILSQLAGAALALALFAWMQRTPPQPEESLPPMTDATILHNPACGTSRNVLALIRANGIEPEIVEYLKTPPTRERLRALVQAMDLPVRGLLRQKGTCYDELDLGNAKWSDDQLLDFMVAHPVLINRPIVVTPLGARLCRPSEQVLDILPARLQHAATYR